MIDLHTHTTASDGCVDPEELIRRAVMAGLRTIGVTDHDTMGGVARAAAAAAAVGITCVPGIEITAVDSDRDVHVLGYFLDPDEPRLRDFLARQRQDRVRRIVEMSARLDALGYPVDVAEALAEGEADRSRSLGRPLLARALVRAGHATDTNDAFARLLGTGRPAYVPRLGASPVAVVQMIHEAGGVASLAHPGQTRCDALLPALVEAGLDALEVHHPDHPPDVEAHYASLARDLGLAVTGGSDYHGRAEHGSPTLGTATMSEAEFDALVARRDHARATRRATASGLSTSS